MKENNKRYWWKATISFLLVLFTMPLGHALMITMEHLLSPTALHYSAFGMGAVGLAMVIYGVFATGDTRQTLWGFFGGLLFWTGWVEFVFMYYAQRFGVHPELTNGIVTTTTEYINGIASQPQMFINGELITNIHDAEAVSTRPEYLMLSASFGFWMMFMLIYLFSIRSGCDFFNWCQRKLFRSKRNIIVARPMTRHTSIVTFMELNMILWTSYLLLMFCYDDNFLGETHIITPMIGAGCLAGSVYMFIKQLRLSSWGANIRMSIATVIVFWTPIEILGRLDFFSEIWVAPFQHKTEMICLLIAFLLLAVYLWFNERKKKDIIK